MSAPLFRFLIAVALLVAQAHVGTPLVKIPEWLHVCPSDNPNLAECIMDSVRSLTPVLETGYPELDLPSLNPFEIERFVVSRMSGLTMELLNLKIFNAHKAIISNLKVVEHGRRYEFDVLYRSFVANGTYHLSGQLMMIPLNARGAVMGRYEDVNSHCKVHIVHQRNANGDYSPVVKTLQMRTKVKGGTLQLDNLLGKNQQLSDALNKAINDNFVVFSEELLPIIDGKFGAVMKDYTNKLFEHFTSEQLYPGVVVKESTAA